jgi:carbamoyl-phosphate synthase small subunit
VRWEESSAAKAWSTHVNLNDGTLEGLRFKNFSGLSVQYHPEASPGPHDSRYLFDSFLQLVHEHGRDTVSVPVDRTATD